MDAQAEVARRPSNRDERADRPVRSARTARFRDRMTLRAIGSPLGALLDGVTAVRYTAASGVVVVPVEVARGDGGAVLIAGSAERKRWWRHFRHPAAAELWLDRRWVPVTIGVLEGADADAAAQRYVARFPGARRALDAAGGSAARVLGVEGALGSPPPLEGAPFLRAWIPTVAAAELLGFLAPVAVGVATAPLPWPVSVPLVLAAGAVEGTLLGGGQALVLRRALPLVRSGRWIALTAVGAVLAYAVVAPGTWIGAFDALPDLLRVALTAVSALALLGVLGGAQWLELRRSVSRAGTWILWVALGWLVALGAFLAIATPLWQPGQPGWLALLIGVLAGVVMAAVQAVVTGAGMRHLLATHRRRLMVPPPPSGT